MQLFKKMTSVFLFLSFNQSTADYYFNLFFFQGTEIWFYRNVHILQESYLRGKFICFFLFFFVLKKSFFENYCGWCGQSETSVMFMKMKFPLQYQAKDSTVPPVLKTCVAPAASSTNCTYILLYFFTCRFRFVHHFSLLWNLKLTFGDIVCVFFYH